MALNTYLDRMKEAEKKNLRPNLEAPKPITQAGGIYQQRVTQNLLNPNPVVKQAQEQADTDISRRNYLTRKQSQEDIAQSPFGAGTQQATRLMDQSRAGANMANLQQRQNTNVFARDTAERDLNTAGMLEDSSYNKAASLEQTGYNRFRDADTTDYTRKLAERTNDQIERGRYSALIEDPKARYAYNKMVASGTAPEDAYQSIVGDTGTIQEQYRGINPVGTMQEDAREWITATTDLTPGTPEFEQAVKDRITAVDAAKQEPLESASESREEKDESKSRIDQILDGDFDVSSLKPDDVQYLKKNDIEDLVRTGKVQELKDYENTKTPVKEGDVVVKNGKLYKVLRQDTDYAGAKNRVGGFGPKTSAYRRDRIRAIPLEGGTEEIIWTGNKY